MKTLALLTLLLVPAFYPWFTGSPLAAKRAGDSGPTREPV